MPQGLLTLLAAVDALSKVSNADSWDKQVDLQHMTSHTILRFSRKMDSCISLDFMCSAYEVDYFVRHDWIILKVKFLLLA